MLLYERKYHNIFTNSRFIATLLPYFFSLSILLLLVYCISIPNVYSQENENDITELKKRYLEWLGVDGYTENENGIIELQKSAVKVFLDVSPRYQEYIKEEIPYVNYVRDRKLAQVHIMMTIQRTGSGGRENTITFFGQQDFIAVNDTLIYVSNQLDTEDIVRRGIVRILKMGLVRYVSKTPLSEYLSINYLQKTVTNKVVDKWNYWVFNMNANTLLNGEESRKEFSIRGSLSADRVTPDWKTSLNASTDYSRRDYETDESDISSYRRSQNFQGLIVKSISKHLSTGFYGSAQSSIYLNNRFSYNVAPAIEYNVFPYSEYTYREFRFLYKAGFTDIRYYEESIFNKIQEYLFDESLSATLELKEKWGSITTTLEGSHYFHDFSKNRLRLNCNINLRLFEGLSIDIRGMASMIHDQLSLPKEGATEEEVLLNQRQLSTQYDFFFLIGLRYTFGSIYSNVVNPRFGGNGRRRGGFRGGPR